MLFNNLKIRARLLLSFSIVIFALAFIGVIGIGQINKINKNSYSVYQHNVRPLETLEKFKSSYAALRRQLLMAVIQSQSDNPAGTEGAIKDLRAQFLITKDACQDHLDRLTEVGASNDSITTTKNILKNLTEAYGPMIETISNAAAGENDFEAMLGELTKADEAVNGITDTMNILFANDISVSAVNSAEVAETSGNAIIILAIAVVIAVIISLAVSLAIGNSIYKSVSKLRTTAEEIAKGNLDIPLSDNARDEFGELTRTLGIVAESVKCLMNDLGQVSGDYRNGMVNSRIDAHNYHGAFMTVANSINNMLDDTVEEIILFLNVVNELGNGNFGASLKQLKNDKVLMNDTFETIKDKLINISKEINEMVSSAAGGNLSKRADSSKYNGDWAVIMNGLNDLMTAVSSPIQESEEALSSVAAGNFERIVLGDYQGSFRLIKNSINDMMKNMDSYISEVTNILGAVSKDNLDQGISREYVGKFTEIRDAINNIINKFNQVISDISAAADMVASGARQISESSVGLAQGATEQASAVEELNATVQLINQNTTNNAENAKEAKDLSERSKNNAAKGDSDMKNMLESMEGIKESSNNISKIIKVINDIAFQTNMLALNAAVEAARAGVHGKGFAVVAEEVRDLAGRSQNAAKETALMIEESIVRVDDGAKMASMTAQSLQTIVKDATRVADIVSDIAIASQEQSDAIGQVMDGLIQITDVVQNNSAASEETASASQELSSQADLLQNLVKVFILKKNKG